MLNISTSGHSRFQDKLDKVFWFIIVVLPLVFMLVFNIVPVSVLADTDKEEEVIEEVIEDNYNYFLSLLEVDIVHQDILPCDCGKVRFCLKDDLSAYITVDIFAVDFEHTAPSDSYFPFVPMSDTERYCPSDTYVKLVDTPSNAFISSFDWTDGSKITLSTSSFVIDYDYAIDLVAGDSFYIYRVEKEPVVEDTPTEDESTVEEEKNTYTFITLKNVLVDCFGLDVDSKNGGGIVGRGLSEMFGKDGVFPVFTEDSGMMYYMTYVVYVEILHVFVDLLLFIPRFAHKILSKAINFGD